MRRKSLRLRSGDNPTRLYTSKISRKEILYLQLFQMTSSPEMEKIEAVLWSRSSKLEITNLMVHHAEVLEVGAVLEVVATTLLRVDTGAAVELVTVREDAGDEAVEDPEVGEEASVVEDVVVVAAASRPKVPQLLHQRHLRQAVTLKTPQKTSYFSATFPISGTIFLIVREKVKGREKQSMPLPIAASYYWRGVSKVWAVLL